VRLEEEQEELKRLLRKALLLRRRALPLPLRLRQVLETLKSTTRRPFPNADDP
jgi:hypothetical protein